MIIKLNIDGTLHVLPRAVPEPLEDVHISYIFPKGLNHLKPVLTWGGEDYEGNNIRIKKEPSDFKMIVTLYNENSVFKKYYSSEAPKLYIGYHIEKLEPNLLKRLLELELENKELKERGDIL